MTKPMTGREFVEKTQKMTPEELLYNLLQHLKLSEPVLMKLPQDEEHSSPIALWLLAAEVGRRYTELNNTVAAVAALTEEFATTMMASTVADTPQKDRS